MFTQEQYKEKLQELAGLKKEMSLDIDPTAAGLKSFNMKLSQIQQTRERISALALEALWNKTEAHDYLETQQALYEKKFAEMLSTNEEIQALRSNDLRKAKIDTALASEVDTVQLATRLYHYADTFHKSIANVDKLYDIKNNNLLQQIVTVRMMLNIDPALRDEMRLQRGDTDEA